MPSDPARSADDPGKDQFTGRCYCGAVTLSFASRPDTVAYCHCIDCRRWTGAPVGAVAALDQEALIVHPPLGVPFSVVEGVDRWHCKACGSPIAARFTYLPGQIYVPVGLIDQADRLAPALHCHAGARLSWLHLADDLPRHDGSGRDQLNTTQG